VTSGPAADTSATYRETVRALAGAQKSPKGAPAYSRLINRPAGRYIAAAAFQLGMNPNQVTAVSATFSYAAIALLALARPTVLVGILVTVGLVAGYALDSADGQLARLQGGGSPSGEWLDHMVDCAKVTSLHLAVLISAYRFFGFSSESWLLVPIGYVFVAVVLFFGMTLTDQLRRAAGRRPSPVAEANSWVRAVAVIPTDYGLLCLVFVLLGANSTFFSVYAVLFACNLGFLLLALVKWFRELNSLRPDAPRSA
jgi:phosphatidylglycerophosphate synthase